LIVFVLVALFVRGDFLMAVARAAVIDTISAEQHQFLDGMIDVGVADLHR
jgi:hypothetical protein